MRSTPSHTIGRTLKMGSKASLGEMPPIAASISGKRNTEKSSSTRVMRNFSKSIYSPPETDMTPQITPSNPVNVKNSQGMNAIVFMSLLNMFARFEANPIPTFMG